MNHIARFNFGQRSFDQTSSVLQKGSRKRTLPRSVTALAEESTPCNLSLDFGVSLFVKRTLLAASASDTPSSSSRKSKARRVIRCYRSLKQQQHPPNSQPTLNIANMQPAWAVRRATRRRLRRRTAKTAGPATYVLRTIDGTRCLTRLWLLLFLSMIVLFVFFFLTGECCE